ncbi:MAG TPA: acetoacetate decarboxylase family protein [Polyangiales bacterium]|nr:acetoacetate decarboxylase family protein [Polyangiales bacterium]
MRCSRHDSWAAALAILWLGACSGSTSKSASTVAGAGGVAEADGGSGASGGAAAHAGSGGAGKSAAGGAAGASAAAGGAGGTGGSSGTPAAAGSGGGGTGTSGAPAAGSGGGRAGSSAGAGAAGTAAPALGPDCGSDPLAGKQPHGSGFYQKFHGLFGCTPPADLALFRKMLPEKFEMPADPQVCFYTIDFEISGVGRYHEAAILLPITYKGQSGKYVLTMDLDNRAATTGGRAMGFPKYQGQVTVERNGNDWTGTASANGKVDLKASYTGQCTKSDEFLWPDFINLTPIPSGTTSSQAFLPPRTGSALRVPAEFLSDKTFHSLKGSIKLEIGDDLPWNGLVDETKPFPGLWSAFVGGVDLGNQPLD